MSELDRTLTELRAHEGVEHVLVLGRDGLLIQHLGDDELDLDTVAAMAPGIAASADSLAGAAALGTCSTAVLELEHGVAIVLALSADLLLAVLLRGGVGFAPLLHALRRDRARLAELV